MINFGRKMLGSRNELPFDKEWKYKHKHHCLLALPPSPSPPTTTVLLAIQSPCTRTGASFAPASLNEFFRRQRTKCAFWVSNRIGRQLRKRIHAKTYIQPWAMDHCAPISPANSQHELLLMHLVVRSWLREIYNNGSL